MKPLTIFTTTYNRGYCLTDLYESLLRQINDDFEWLIIDDGSDDNTWDLVEDWLFRKEMDIQYIRQENLGIPASHNVAYKNIKTKYVMCVDSDDYLPDYSVGLILEKVKLLNDQHAGLIGLCVNDYGITIGDEIPENLIETTTHDLYTIHKVSGHKKMIFKTAVIREFPEYPIFSEEKALPLNVLYAQIDQKYLMKTLNEPICVCRFPADRYSKDLLLQSKRNLRGFAYASLLKIELYKDFQSRFKYAVHLTAYSRFLKDKNLLSQVKDKRLMSLAKPCGLYYYFTMKKKLRSKI